MNNDDRSGCAPPFQKSRSAPGVYKTTVYYCDPFYAYVTITDHAYIVQKLLPQGMTVTYMQAYHC